MHYNISPHHLTMTAPFLPIPLSIIGSVEYEILEQQKTAEFGGSIIWFFILAIIVGSSEGSFQSQECR